MRWKKEDIASLAENYQYRSDFAKAHRNAYQYAHKYGFLDEICKHMSSRHKRSKHLNHEPGTYEYRKSAYLKHMYGITYEEYNEKLKSQNYCCAICNNHEDLGTRKLSVDHCHTSGKVRGLLCDNCNHGLGKFRDNTEILKQAITYLDLFP